MFCADFLHATDTETQKYQEHNKVVHCIEKEKREGRERAIKREDKKKKTQSWLHLEKKTSIVLQLWTNDVLLVQSVCEKSFTKAAVLLAREKLHLKVTPVLLTTYITLSLFIYVSVISILSNKIIIWSCENQPEKINWNRIDLQGSYHGNFPTFYF